MYGPAPPRRKKTQIVRARTGCGNCRQRRKKCDERRPACGACTRLGKLCDGYASKLEFRSVSFTTPAPPSQSHGVVQMSQPPSAEPQQQRTEKPEGQCLALTPTSASSAPWVDATIAPSRESFYMSVWGSDCAPALHPIFNRLARLETLSPVVTDTMMALAARQLSRRLPRPRPRHSGALGMLESSSFRPDLDQQTISGEFSAAAMRRVARWTREDFERNTTTSLAVLILFCYLESLVSDFPGFYLHSSAVGSLLERVYGDSGAQLGSHGAELVGAWVQSRMHNWWRRFHFGTAAFQRDHPPLTTEISMVLPSVMTENSSRASVLLILCESYRLNAANFMHLCRDGLDGSSSMPQGGETFFGIPQLSSSRMMGFVLAQEMELDCQRDALRDWHTRLPPSELPVDFTLSSSDGTCCWEAGGLPPQPLRFQSHDAAMNFAYYLTARVMQCTQFLRDLQEDDAQTGNANADAGNDAEPWILLLLRVVAGADWESCARLNCFTIGLSGLLLACVLRSNSPAIGLWVEDWLSQRYEAGCLEEGSFPLFQSLQVLRVVNGERRSGRHVYAVCQPIDDGGGAGKFDSYNSQKLATVVVYGRYMDTGGFYYRPIALEDPHFGMLCGAV